MLFIGIAANKSPALVHAERQRTTPICNVTQTGANFAKNRMEYVVQRSGANFVEIGHSYMVLHIAADSLCINQRLDTDIFQMNGIANTR